MNFLQAVIDGDLRRVSDMHNESNGTYLESDIKYIDFASMHGHLDIIKFLHENGYSASDWATNWASRGIVSKYFAKVDDKGDRLPTDQINCSKMEEDVGLLVVSWLADNRKEGCSPTAFFFAKDYKRTNIYDFLVNRYPEVYEEYLHIGMYKIAEKIFKDWSDYNKVNVRNTISQTKFDWKRLNNDEREKYRELQLKKPFYPPMLKLWE